MKTVRIGSITIESADTAFWLPGTGHDHAAFQLHVGNVFFKDFVVTFDFRKKVVILEKP